jgi:UTP--glucose-1-phosphate uridylyltransferase
MTTDAVADFSPFAARMQAANLAPLLIDTFAHYYATLAAGQTGFIAEAEIEPVEHVPTIADLSDYANAGLAAVGRAAVLKLNGGLGTSMGLERAKSLLIAREQLSFLDIIIRQSLASRTRYGRQVPLIFMNSFNTDADTHEVLAAYPELDSAVPLTFVQSKVPKIRQDTLAPAEWPADPDLEWCPPGHGEVYVALHISGLLDQLLALGYEYLFLSNADNLGATLDLRILGYMAEKNVPFVMEVAQRSEADKKGGHLTRRSDGQLILREVAQCHEADLPQFQDIQRHRYFNTNNIWVNLRTLQATLAANNYVLQLPMIRNQKTIDPKQSTSPAVYQLETAMGSAIAVFPGAQAVCVERDRFVPVKLCSDLLVLRSDVYQLDADYRLQATLPLGGTLPAVDLDSRFYKLIDGFEARFADGPPSLVECSKLTVRGDVRFEHGVVCRGEATVVNRAATQQFVPSATQINNTTLELTER